MQKRKETVQNRTSTSATTVEESNSTQALESMEYILQNKTLLFALLSNKLLQSVKLIETEQLTELLTPPHSEQPSTPYGIPRQLIATPEETDHIAVNLRTVNPPYKIALAHLKILLDAMYEFDDLFARIVDTEFEVFLHKLRAQEDK